MGRHWLHRSAKVVLACGVAAGVVGASAQAVNDNLTIFSGFLEMDGGTDIGTGGDGSVVLMTASYAFLPPEEPITVDDLIDRPYLYYNPDLFSWAPGQDHVRQFTATGITENEDGDALLFDTESDEPSVFTRTGDARNQEGTRISAAAYATNADPTLPGPANAVTSINGIYAALGQNGRVIVYRDSELDVFVPLVTVPHFQQCFEPSVAFRTKVTNRGSNKTGNFRTLALTDAWVAFAGSANNNQDNNDGNDEIHLWTRSQYLASVGSEGFLNNNGILQITHTNSGDCWSPSVSINGDVAFVSDADITGENADGSSEIFVYRRKRGTTEQITDISPARYVDNPCWGDNGRRLVFESDADPNGTNGDASTEIFVWSGKKVKQLTKAATGDSFSPAMDPYGTTVAFLTDAPLPNVVYGGVPRPEIVTTSATKVRYKQITQVNDGETNEAPRVTRNRVGRVQVTFVSTSNLDGRNNNNNRRIYRATVK